jgi:hypothetical protein
MNAMKIQTLVRPAKGDEFQAAIIAVHDFGGARGLEAMIEYQSVSGMSWAWLSTAQMIPQRDWGRLAEESQNVRSEAPTTAPRKDEDATE